MGARSAASRTPLPSEAGSRTHSVTKPWNGAVTRTEFGPALIGSLSSCSGRGGGSPRPERFVWEDAKRAAGGEMALDVECVVDGGVNGQETLGGSGRFETLHLALAPSCRLMRILSPIVRA